MMDIFEKKLIKRSIDIACLDAKSPEISGSSARQTVVIKQGIETDTAKKMVKAIKSGKLKVQASIQEQQVRVNGKKRDDLQQVIALIKNTNVGLPLQFINFRD